jgi:hypothetical protein
MGRKSAVLTKPETVRPLDPPAGYDESLNELEVADPDAEEAAGDSLETEAAITDNVGEQSIEINVENLIAELEAESQHGKSPDVQCARRKLEDYLERKRIAAALEDFEDFLVED